MTKLRHTLIFTLLATLPGLVNAASDHGNPAVNHATKTSHAASSGPVPVSESEQLKAIVGNLLQDNEAFAASRNEAYFRPLMAGQTPRATVVTCSDSRVHTQALDSTPDGDLFMVRNIGNQLATAEGSVEYGVHHLHTPLLIFVGHSSCGAIKAASGDYRKESKTIRRELDTIKISKGSENMMGVKLNVNNQVASAMKKFSHEVKDGHLTVIGAVYDFSNELGKGYGKLNIINLNGDTDAARIAGSRLLAGSIEVKPTVSQKASAIRSAQKPPAATTGSSDPHPYSYP